MRTCLAAIPLSSSPHSLPGFSRRKARATSSVAQSFSQRARPISRKPNHLLMFLERSWGNPSEGLFTRLVLFCRSERKMPSPPPTTSPPLITMTCISPSAQHVLLIITRQLLYRILTFFATDSCLRRPPAHPRSFIRTLEAWNRVGRILHPYTICLSTSHRVGRHLHASPRGNSPLHHPAPV